MTEMSEIPEVGGASWSRRQFLAATASGALGVTATSNLIPVQPRVRPDAKARSVIQIWMWGGPCHIDTFDPKPEAGSDYTGPLSSPIATNVDGLRIGQLLPMLAKQAHRYSVIRGMTHGVNGHETASYIVQTGHKSGGRVVHPSVGAVVSRFRGYAGGYKGLIPPYIVLTRPQGRFSEAGFLGSRYKPFATGGDPGRREFLVEGISTAGVTRKRQESRRKLLHQLDGLRRDAQGDPSLMEFEDSERRAYDLILGEAGKIFDLSQEKPELRERYGRNTFGQSCLMARRLVEKGIPYITINYRGWDTHKQHFQTMNRRLPEMDRGMATLIDDLAQRGPLDSTIVWWTGEFGRTPKVQWGAPWNGGRGHHGAAFSAVVAGGGFKGGHVIGATDAKGMSVVSRPVYPWDLIAGMYELLGIDPSSELRHPLGFMVPLIPSAKDGYDIGGRLDEIL